MYTIHQIKTYRLLCSLILSCSFAHQLCCCGSMK
uniref:Uncharacterized protein n=1 Tax=Arundo donax TaxID=35708 RepID=A0A0A9C3T6_ARUDO